MNGTYPFGRPSTERAPRRASGGRAELFVLGVYPSALHVRWRRPDDVVRVQALAVDDEPEVFWDGADADERVDRWRRDVGWQRSWGSVTASTNGTSGRGVLEGVLRPLNVEPERVWFTDCIRRFFVKGGKGSQREAIATDYAPFAETLGLPAARLPARPTPPALVRLAVDEDGGALSSQLDESGAVDVVTLGQEAADVFARLSGVDGVRLRSDDAAYGNPQPFRLGASSGYWTALKHPGQRQTAWVERHARWAASCSST